MSDAGTPGFSDPGADLVARAWEAGVKVEAVPGPAAGVAALSLSGFKGDILFVGFLPRGEGRRLKMFQALAPEPRVIIMYESPRRLARTLAEIAGAMPNREVLVVRELTKKFEQTWRGQLAEIAARFQDVEIKGECALVLSCPAAEAAVPPADLTDAWFKPPGKAASGPAPGGSGGRGSEAAPAAGLPGLPGPEGAGQGGVRADQDSEQSATWFLAPCVLARAKSSRQDAGSQRSFRANRLHHLKPDFMIKWRLKKLHSGL